MSPNARGMSFSHTNSPILLHTKVANNSIQLPELAQTPQVKGSVPEDYSYCRHQRKWGSQATCTSTQPTTKQVVPLGLPQVQKFSTAHRTWESALQYITKQKPMEGMHNVGSEQSA